MASTAKKIVLITGANSGIGYELASQLLAKGHHVLLGSRSQTKGTTALQSLQSLSHPGTATLLPLDLTLDSSISEATSTISTTFGKLDILVNNAAVAVPQGTDREQLRVAFDTNATGPYVLTKSLLPLLKRAGEEGGEPARIVNISSGVGSIGRKMDPSSPMHKYGGVQYRASKAALNMVHACQFVEFGDMGESVVGRDGWESMADVLILGIKVFLYDPGFTVSNLSPMNTAENGARSPRESVSPLVDVIEGKRDSECGLFMHNTGTYPW